MNDNTPQIVIIGAGGHAKVIVSALIANGQRPWRIFDDNANALAHTELLGCPITPTEGDAWWKDNRPTTLIAIGDNAARKSIAARRHADFVSIIHPTAKIDPSAKIGRGVFVSAGAIIQAEARIGDHTIINTGVIIEHDCDIGPYVHIGPGTAVCGGVRVREGTLIGVGTCVVPLAKIGAWTTIGAGASVVSDIPDHVTAMGCPARVVERG